MLHYSFVMEHTHKKKKKELEGSPASEKDQRLQRSVTTIKWTHTPYLELLSLARSPKLYFDAAMCTLCRWRIEYIYIYILYYIYINIMCKYLLKRKFPRDIYSWFITSYI